MKLYCTMKPFWRYYGGKFRIARRYPIPGLRIVEPFAGAAGYAMRYPDRAVILVDKYPIVTGIWRWLIGASENDIRTIPSVRAVGDLPSWVCQEARWLVGFWLNSAVVSPRLTQSAGRKRMEQAGCKLESWNDAVKDRIAGQVQQIRHWKVIEGDYTCAPDIEATWFIDPPYNNRAGSYYVHSDIDYVNLAAWCRDRRGHTIVCENDGASWLPFRPFTVLKRGINGGRDSREVIWDSTVDA